MKVRLKIMALVCAWLILLVSVVSLVGYLIGYNALTQLMNNCPVRINSSPCFFLLALALFAGNITRQELLYRMIYYLSLALVILISALTVFEHITGIDLHIDNLSGLGIQMDSGCTLRTSFITSTCFLLIGISFVISYDRVPRRKEALPLTFSGLVFFGLATVKKSIEKEGGQIWLESERGKGTTFFFSIIK